MTLIFVLRNKPRFDLHHSLFFTFGDQRLLEMLILYREAPYLRRSVWIPVILAIVMVQAIINVDRIMFDCHLYSEVTRGHC